MIRSLLELISNCELFALLSLPYPGAEGSERLWWVSGIQLRSTHYMEVNASFSLASATKEKDTKKVWHFFSGGEKLAKKTKLNIYPVMEELYH